MMAKRYDEDERPKVKWLDGDCGGCGGRINSWDEKVSKALGYHGIVCEKCISKEYNRSVEEIRDIMEEYFGMKPCRGI